MQADAAPALQGRVRGATPAAEGRSPALAEVFAAAMILQAFPAVVLAWKSTGTRLAARPDDRQEADWHAAGEVLADFHGHGSCGSWTFDPWTQEAVCALGHDLLGTAATEGVLAA